MTNIECVCCSQKNVKDCCKLFISGTKKPVTALELMRTRYTAYATHQADYLLATTHFLERNYYSKSEILNWATTNQWLQLEIINATVHTVEFKAHFLDSNQQKQIHHELSKFKFEDGSWFYVDGELF